MNSTGLDRVVVNGGYEYGGHSSNSFHYFNMALDVAGPRFNNLSQFDVLNAARAAGFTHIVYEDFKGNKSDHWHMQVGSGNGIDSRHSVNNFSIYRNIKY